MYTYTNTSSSTTNTTNTTNMSPPPSTPSTNATITITTVHAEGEIGDVITSGIPDPVHLTSMYAKLCHFRDNADHYRQLLMQEPRGRVSQCMNLLLAPCDPAAHAGFLILESDEYAPMSGSNTMCVTTVLLESGMVPMQEPVTHVVLDTAAGIVRVRAECAGGKCMSVEFDNVPAFVQELGFNVDVPGLGGIEVDVAWGGMYFVLVDAEKLGLSIENRNGRRLVELGQAIFKRMKEVCRPVHPLNKEIQGVSILEFTGPLTKGVDGEMTAVNTVVVSPGRFDRSPCGTGTSARMAVLHAKGLLQVGEKFVHKSIVGTEFQCSILGTTKVGEYKAVLTRIKGRAWITGYRQVLLDNGDPFPVGFRVGDVWGMDE
jgi:proline racemase